MNLQKAIVTINNHKLGIYIELLCIVSNLRLNDQNIWISEIPMPLVRLDKYGTFAKLDGSWINRSFFSTNIVFASMN